jgi:hypothetical protein
MTLRQTPCDPHLGSQREVGNKWNRWRTIDMLWPCLAHEGVLVIVQDNGRDSNETLKR